MQTSGELQLTAEPPVPNAPATDEPAVPHVTLGHPPPIPAEQIPHTALQQAVPTGQIAGPQRTNPPADPVEAPPVL
jgi:hypothetical protein